MPCHSPHLRPYYMDTVESFSHIWTPVVSKYGSFNRRKPGTETFFGAKFKIYTMVGFFNSGIDYPRWTPLLYSICADDLNTTPCMVFRVTGLIVSHPIISCHAIPIIPSSRTVIIPCHAMSFPSPPPFLYGHCRKFCPFLDPSRTQLQRF